ncbi:MAG: hypothetical protein K8W52_44450, partial [Deltaproteobacteria bacterium]|nr:hypothetical protein [Deltaproteobacteria bacterium]
LSCVWAAVGCVEDARVDRREAARVASVRPDDPAPGAALPSPRPELDACDALPAEPEWGEPDCCRFLLGCASEPVPAACLPPANQCWHLVCHLTDGTTALAGACS